MSNQSDKVRQVLELRRSSAASPHRNKRRYTRKVKYRTVQD